jgi:cytoskeletal protein CcmA (bactofilin family)
MAGEIDSAVVEGAFRIRGDVDSLTHFEVPAGSEVEGMVQARRLRIGGTVRGPVSAREGIVVAATGSIEGALRGGTLNVQEGGTCRGTCRVGRRSVSADEAPPINPPPQGEKWFWQS